MIELLWNAPVCEAKISSQIQAMSLADDDRVLDVGCGCGEILLRVCEQHHLDATGVDASATHIAEARRRTASRKTKSTPQFVVADVKDWAVESESLDAVLCLGASHAFGLGSQAYLNALECMVAMIRPGGQILISEAYAKQKIPNGYKEFIGDSTTDDMTHESNVRVGLALGLVALGAWTSSDDEWDEFEWAYQRVIEQKANAPDADSQAAKRLVDRRRWMDGYLRWGRGTLGYGTYLFKKPVGESK